MINKTDNNNTVIVSLKDTVHFITWHNNGKETGGVERTSNPV